MVTSGKALTIAALALLVGSACSQPAADTTMTSAQQPPIAIQSSSCTDSTPASWRALIAEATVRLPRSATVIPFATGTGPDRFFAEIFSPTWSGVASVSAPQGQIDEIRAFEHPTSDQAYAGAFDGRWLVWIVQLSLVDSNDWEIWAFDTKTDSSFRIATAPRVAGHTIPGPIVEPVLADGVAAWVQANESGTGDIHEYSLATRTGSVIATHATTPVAFWGSSLLWMHLDLAGQSGHFEMADAEGRNLPVPEPLASVHSAAFVAASGDVVAWTDLHTLWTGQSGKPAATRIFESDSDDIQFIAIAGRLVTWDGSTGPMALDMQTSAVTPLTPANGGRFASGRSLLVYWPSGSGKSVTMVVSDVDVARLAPLPACR